jgi:hypothetical protein
MTYERIFTIWVNMRQRCSNPNWTGYHLYGGRGIKVCEEWIDSLEAFYEWAVENGYSEILTLDRINNNGDYEPSNCRWATPKEQANNTRNTTWITAFGITDTASGWENRSGISANTIKQRLTRYGYEPELAVSILPKSKGKKTVHVCLESA